MINSYRNLKYKITCKSYIEIVKDYEKLLVSHTLKREWMFIDFSYTNKELDYTDVNMEK